MCSHRPKRLTKRMLAKNDAKMQKSVAHLDYHVDYQYSNLGVPHISEHSPGFLCC